ncbi:MAG: TetR/AcrR family transcriptional regulator [Pseudomonadota bacterium]|nr:TetR/AcrR family transcriptional regulator [Pseudomonadota bacterium]
MSGDDTRERILEAAAPLFATEGFAGASTRAIAQASGVNIATLAYHFGDKRGLYAALVDRTYARLVDVEIPGADEPDPEARLRVMVKGLYHFARAHHLEVRVLLRHVLENRRLPEAVSTRWLGPLLARVGDALAPLGIPLDADRMLALLSLNHLIVRFAITEPADLAPFGIGDGGDGDPHARIADHLADVACRLLGVGSAPRA